MVQSQPPMNREEQTTTATNTHQFTTPTTITTTQQPPRTLNSPSPSPSSSATNPRQRPLSLATLPSELIRDILLRLPVKSLLRFRVVCKSWETLISDPQFAKQHLRASLGTGESTNSGDHFILTFKDPSRGSAYRDDYHSLPSVFNANSSATSIRRNFPCIIERRYESMRGSCHGMLCVAATRGSPPYLWNPSTGKFKDLPYLKERAAGEARSYGFGYDDRSDSYKMVAAYPPDDDENGLLKNDVEVYTLGTDSWREIRPFHGGYFDMGTGIYLNGRLNWLAMVITRATLLIVSFDLGTEMCQEIRFPLSVREDGFNYGTTLAVLKGCLCIFNQAGTASDVWLMRDYGDRDSWTKLLSIPYLVNQPSAFYQNIVYNLQVYHFKPLCVFGEDNDEILFEYESNRRLVIYNSKRGTFYVPPGIQNLQRLVAANMYSESLISPCCL